MEVWIVFPPQSELLKNGFFQIYHINGMYRGP